MKNNYKIMCWMLLITTLYIHKITPVFAPVSEKIPQTHERQTSSPYASSHVVSEEQIAQAKFTKAQNNGKNTSTNTLHPSNENGVDFSEFTSATEPTTLGKTTPGISFQEQHQAHNTSSLQENSVSQTPTTQTPKITYTRTRTSIKNTFDNAFSMSGNKKTTSTNSANKTITETTKDKNGKIIATKTTNEQGLVIETTSVNPVSGAKSTVTYKNPGKDKSSTTVIENETDPNSPITEERNEKGELISIQDKKGTEIGIKGKNGKIVPTKTNTKTNEPADREENIPTLQDISEEEFNLFQNSIEIMAKNLNKEQTQGLWMDTTFPAVKKINDRIKALPEATRNLTIDTLAQLQKHKASASNKGNLEPDESYKENIANTMLQKHINNVFGTDTMSGENSFSLDNNPELKTKLINAIKSNHDLFDPTKSTNERTQAIADSTDLIMNTLSNYDPNNNAGTPPPFRTSIDKDGNYSTIITNNAGISSKVTVNKNGKTTERKLTVINPDGNSPTSAAVFITSFDANQKPSTILKRGDINDSKDPDAVNLSGSDEQVIEAAHTNLTTRQIAIAMTKATLWTIKQAAPNLIKVSPHAQLIIVGAAAPALVLVKAGSMAMGYKYSDPVVRSFIKHAAELTVGNRRGFLTADLDRLFTQGTAPSKALSLLQGKMKTNIQGANMGSALYEAVTTFSIDPLAKSYSIAFPEDRNPTEEYYRSLDDIVVENVLDAFHSNFKSKVMPTDSSASSTSTATPSQAGSKGSGVSSMTNELNKVTLGSSADSTLLGAILEGASTILSATGSVLT